MSVLSTPDAIFHQPVRTRVAALLYRDATSFAELKRALDVTDGNLDAHLRKLGGAGYLHSRVVLEGRPHTVYELSPRGRDAFVLYLKTLRERVAFADK